MRLPIPDDWDQERDGYVLVMMCVPDSMLWRALIRGRISDITGGRAWDERTGRITAVQVVAREIFDSMAMCKLDDLLTEFKRLNAILAGEELTVIKDGVTSHWDYTESGLVPTLEDIGPVSTVAKLEELRVTLETRSVAETTAGNTRNTALVSAIDRAVAEIDDIEPYNDLALIAKLEELRTMLEARSVAETTAANTRNTALIKAVGEIDATTTVNLTNTNGCGNCGELACDGSCTGSSWTVEEYPLLAP